MNKKNIVLFVNDSYFSYLLAKPMIKSNHEKISTIIFSKSTVSSLKKVFNIFKKVTLQYFLYRSFIQLISVFLFIKKSIEFLANKYNIRKKYVYNSSDLRKEIDTTKVAFLFNFDIIIKKIFYLNLKKVFLIFMLQNYLKIKVYHLYYGLL